MSWSVAVSTGQQKRPRLAAIEKRRAAKPSGHRRVFDGRLGRAVEAAIHERHTLAPGDVIDGPAIVVEDGTSTLITSSFDAQVDNGGALVMTLKEAR